VFTGALALFTLASAACAAAPTLGLLVTARVVQAAGAAALVPSSLAIVLESRPEGERQHAVALWAAVAALAAGIGPPLGGLLITASSWRLVFLVNIPIGLAALALTRRVIVESRAPGRRQMPDLIGGLVLAAAIATLVAGVVKGQEWGWGSAHVVIVFAASAVLWTYFVWRSTRQRNPVIDLALLRIRAFTVSNGATIVMASGFYGYTLCNVLFLTTVWRYSILTAGLALTPGPFTAMAVAGPASRLVERVGHRAILLPGALVWAGGMAWFVSRLGVRPDFAGGWLPGMVILGTGAGLTFPTLSGAAVGSMPGPKFAVATSLNSVARQLGAALGVAVLIAILGKPSPAQALDAFEHGWTFAGGCFVAGAIACLALKLPRPAGARESPATGPSPLRVRPTARPAPPGPSVSGLPSLAAADGERAEVATQTVADSLRAASVFADLTPALRERVAELAGEVRLPGGEWLFREGEEADAVYLVRVGHLEVLQEDRDGPRRINTLGKGAVVGELALLNDSLRSASIRALRDTELLRIEKARFGELLQAEPELALSLTRVLSAQLQASRAIPAARRAQPATIALRAIGAGVPVLQLADELSAALCAWGKVAVVHPAGERDAEEPSGFAALIERLERDHDQVVMLCGGDSRPRAWDEFCAARADRVLALVSATATAAATATGARGEAAGGEAPPGEWDALARSLRGCDLVGCDVTPGAGALAGWVRRLAPASIHAIRPGAAGREDIARVARRLAGRSVGVVLGGGGARAFAHVGALDVLLEAGLTVDRVGGVSMGAFVGGLLALGHGADAIDACCYEEWVRRNPINDYTVPRHALIRGRKAEAMLRRTFGDVRIEELPRPYYCASVNLRGNRLAIDRDGPLIDAIGASISLPLIAPPRRREHDGGLMIDGSLLDNLPLEPMSATGEGPVLAIDIKGGEERRRRDSAGGAGAADGAEPSAPRPSRPPRLPGLPETMARIALLSSANTDEAARRLADFTIPVRVPGVGLLEFHQIDEAVAAGRAAALAALADAPAWLTGGDPGARDLSGRRTVVRV
jgi:NTE family protein